MSEYKIPEPKENPAGALVMFYKITKGVEYDDRIWDRKNFGRCMASATDLLEICKTYEEAKKCLEELAEKFIKTDLSWTLETIVKHSFDWKQKKGDKNGFQNRKRFLNALTKQRSDNADPVKGTLLSAGQILDTLGNLQVIGNKLRIENGSGSRSDGGAGKQMEPSALEAEKDRRVG
jgi:hypothetical protein